EDTPEKADVTEQEHAIATASSCALCKVTFSNVEEQRVHVRSDHHRYNLKAQLRGNPTFDEIQFTKAVGELDESISGSESSEEDEEEGDASQPTLTALLKKQAKISQANDDEEVLSKKENIGKNPLLWFSSSILP